MSYKNPEEKSTPLLMYSVQKDMMSSYWNKFKKDRLRGQDDSQNDDDEQLQGPHRAMLMADRRQQQQVMEILKKYTTIDLTEKQIKKKQRDEKIGLLRERYEELKFSQLGDKVMNSYDRYMNVQGMLKKKP